MRSILLLLFIALIASACRTEQNSSASATVKRYEFKGKVVAVDKANKRASIDHEAVPGFMEAMTMEFPIHEDWVWDELQPGADIRAELVVDSSAKDPYWLEKIGIVAIADPNRPQPKINENFVQIGRTVPDFSLTNQDGKRITLDGFRGKALAITFIYARCPLPDYCVKMSTNFSDAAHNVNNSAELAGKAALLTISFDPENDTPAKLKSYGLGYMGKDAKELGVWQLAVGKEAEVRKIAEFFGLQYEVDQNDKTQINHSLRTAVIDPEGKVTKIFAGNGWTAAQLLDELKKAVSEGSK
ncbi:MAG: SCO family protein [Pyrinomonadaceae bacterium]